MTASPSPHLPNQAINTIGQQPTTLPPTNANAITPPAVTESKKSSSWDWIWPIIVAGIIVKVFGLVGGLVTIGGYYWLKPKLGTWGAVAASGILGVVVATGFLAIIRA